MMIMRNETATQCPRPEADERRTAGIAGRGGLVRDCEAVSDFAGARLVLRNEEARQAGFLANLVTRFGGIRPPILFLSGEPHRRQRKATARFFTPAAVSGRYRDLIVGETQRLLAPLRRDGFADLDALALELASTVAAAIVGLTESDHSAMARRVESFTTGGGVSRSRTMALVHMLLSQWRVRRFFLNDVAPAIAARRAAPQDDVISHLVAEGYSDRDILTECVTYGAAAMATTREFITMAGWSMFEQPDLRDRFLAGGIAEQIALLEEILRVEPVVGTIYRRLPETRRAIAIDVRAANSDEAVVGPCPYRIDPDRAIASKVGRPVMAFGDGEHRCPGALVAMNETAIFLDALFRLPGIRLKSAPAVTWNPVVTGYELRGAKLACDLRPV